MFQKAHTKKRYVLCMCPNATIKKRIKRDKNVKIQETHTIRAIGRPYSKQSIGTTIERGQSNNIILHTINMCRGNV